MTNGHPSGLNRRFVAGLILALGVAPGLGQAAPLRVLVLTGANNHDWATTTVALERIFEACPRFTVADVLDDPSKCDAATFGSCDVAVSNWSAWPALTGRQWGATAERAFVDFVRSGGGFVVFHAAGATCHDWPEFQQLVALTWGLDKTAHGAYHTFKVSIKDKEHPITRDLPDFWTTDELWHQMVPLAGPAPAALCEVFSEGAFGGSGKLEPVLVPTRLGKGRGLNLVLGHDVRAMENVGWQTLMLRGAEWAATGRVTLGVPDRWPSCAAAAEMTGIDPEVALRGAAAYKFGQPRHALFQVEQCVNHAVSIAGDAGVTERRTLAAKIADALASAATAEAKVFLCRQLSRIGTERQVEILAALLDDEAVADGGRGALERIGGPAAAGALREALGRVEGGLKVGIVNSLGNVGDARAVTQLAGLLRGSDVVLARAAAGALGKIGGAEASAALSDALTTARGDVRQASADAYLRCARKALKQGDTPGAVKIYRRMYEPGESAPTRMAALRGLIDCRVDEADQLLIEAMTQADPRMRSTAAHLARELKGHHLDPSPDRAGSE